MREELAEWQKYALANKIQGKYLPTEKSAKENPFQAMIDALGGIKKSDFSRKVATEWDKTPQRWAMLEDGLWVCYESKWENGKRTKARIGIMEPCDCPRCTDYED